MAAPTQEAVEEKVIDAIANLGPDRSEITRDASFESLDVDSLDLVEMTQVVDEEFGVQIKGEDAQQLKTVGDAIDFIMARAE
ncbi:MAG: acyl carrier protein [Thermoleophilaceae bacterium]|jgi:acyl carrier protein|nr:acyl carrier protein [Thermoleophilaceae bacterium]